MRLLHSVISALLACVKTCIARGSKAPEIEEERPKYPCLLDWDPVEKMIASRAYEHRQEQERLHKQRIKEARKKWKSIK